MKNIDIIKLFPNRVWRSYLGGRELDRLEGRKKPGDGHYPEDWIASTTEARNNRPEVDDKFEGVSNVIVGSDLFLLTDLFKAGPDFMLGKKHVKKYGLNTGFLLKFLDSSVRLQVQCHPTKEFSKKHLGSVFGKTEGYYILDVRDDVKEPYIFAGFQRPPDKRKFRDAVENQDLDFILSCFEKVPVRKGDAFIIPGGLPHAIGEGILMVELMEPTDFAVRIEFRRGDYELPYPMRYMGKDVDFGMSVFDFKETSLKDVSEKYFVDGKDLGVKDPGVKAYSIFDRRRTDCFRMKRVLLEKGKTRISEDSFFVVIAIDGAGRIRGPISSCKASKGSKFFIPYGSREITVETDDRLELLVVQPSE